MAGWYNKQPRHHPGRPAPARRQRDRDGRPHQGAAAAAASLDPARHQGQRSSPTAPQTIRASVADVQFTLLLTVALVVMVIFLFLRNFWATVIPAVTVPLSLVGTFAVLYELGYSLDNLSLMALSIAVGFVVDDAVVVIENIVRHIEEGARADGGGAQGAGEIGFTIVSITLSLIAVFIPLFLMGGYVGKLFQEFAVTVSVSLVLSLLISLTLTPMMCARLLKPPSKEHGRLYRSFERGFDGLLDVYERGLKIVLRHRFVTLMVMLGTDRADRLSLCRHSQGLLPAAGHRIDHRPRRGGAGYLLPGHGRAPAGAAERRAARIRRSPRSERRIGAGGATTTLNQGRMFIALEAARPARRQRRPGDRAAARQRSPRSRASRSTCRPRRTSPSAGGCPRPSISTPWPTPIPNELNHWAALFLDKLKAHPGHHRRRHRPGERRAAARRHGQSRGRLELRHPAVDDRQHARRRLRPAHRLDHVHAAQPVSRRPRGRSASSSTGPKRSTASM